MVAFSKFVKVVATTVWGMLKAFGGYVVKKIKGACIYVKETFKQVFQPSKSSELDETILEIDVSVNSVSKNDDSSQSPVTSIKTNSTEKFDKSIHKDAIVNQLSGLVRKRVVLKPLSRLYEKKEDFFECVGALFENDEKLQTSFSKETTGCENLDNCRDELDCSLLSDIEDVQYPTFVPEADLADQSKFEIISAEMIETTAVNRITESNEHIADQASGDAEMKSSQFGNELGTSIADSDNIDGTQGGVGKQTTLKKIDVSCTVDQSIVLGVATYPSSDEENKSCESSCGNDHDLCENDQNIWNISNESNNIKEEKAIDDVETYSCGSKKSEKQQELIHGETESSQLTDSQKYPVEIVAINVVQVKEMLRKFIANRGSLLTEYLKLADKLCEEDLTLSHEELLNAPGNSHLEFDDDEFTSDAAEFSARADADYAEVRKENAIAKILGDLGLGDWDWQESAEFECESYDFDIDTDENRQNGDGLEDSDCSFYKGENDCDDGDFCDGEEFFNKLDNEGGACDDQEFFDNLDSGKFMIDQDFFDNPDDEVVVDAIVFENA